MSRIITPFFRGAFVNLAAPRSFEGKDPKYSIMLLIPKKDKFVKELNQKIEQVAKEAKLPKGWTNPLNDGDDKEYDGFAGHYYINAKTDTKPQCVDRDKNFIDGKDELYSGAWYRISCNAFAYNKMGNKGVAFGLNNVQKLKDDEPFGNRTTAEMDFDIVEDDDNVETNW